MPSEPLTIEDSTNDTNGFRLLRLKGPIVITNLFDLQNRIRGNTAKKLILDLSGVPYIDSAGIGALVGAYVSHQKEGRALALVGVNDRIHNALKVTQVESFFRFFDSVDAAEGAAA
jgi:anti-sigma B factor antagonist